MCVSVSRAFSWKRSTREVVANVLDCDIRVSKFELKSLFYVHFWTNALGERNEQANPHLSYGLDSVTNDLLQG